MPKIQPERGGKTVAEDHRLRTNPAEQGNQLHKPKLKGLERVWGFFCDLGGAAGTNRHSVFGAG